jgi:hypothetical protein
MHRTITSLAVFAALALAGSASAATPNCARVALSPTASLDRGSQSVTLTGTGTCTGGAATTEAAQLTLSGTATVGTCFQSPYIAISGTLTTRLAGGSVFQTSATMNLAPDAGLSTGLATLSTGAGQSGVFTVNYDDTSGGGSAIGLISRCGGGEFTFHASGALVAG